MCGIIGVLGNNWSSDSLCTGRDSMAHRGPDDFGFVERKLQNGHRLGFAHRRLSILDPSIAGHQPMEDPETGNIIIHNGEIYNHLEIRNSLPKHTWKSNSDTETILAAYQHWGDKLLERTVGMFAFAIWDDKHQELFIARDRLGIKPLYYIASTSSFCFASEIKALLAAGFAQRKLDPVAVESYLAFGAVQEPHTIIKGVDILAPGHWLRVGVDGCIQKRRCYWFLNEAFLHPSTEVNTEIIRQTFFTAVKDRLISDVPLGAFLSGGIDSSAVVAAMSKSSATPPQTFCLDFAEGENREGRYAEIVANQFKCQHQNILVTSSDLLKDIDMAFSFMDQPTHDGINTYFISKVARQSGVKVALSGQGGDEVFAGYPSFRLVPYALNLVKQPALLRRGITSLLDIFPQQSVRWVKVRDFLKDGPLDVYGAYAHQRGIFWDRLRCDLLADKPSIGQSAEWLRLAVPPSSLASDVVNQVSQLELSCYLRNMLLRDLDVFSMAHSLEVRVPLLDHRLVSLLAGISGTKKIKPKPKPNKHLFVEAMGTDLDPKIVYREKGIFWFPWNHWLKRDLRSKIEYAFNDQYLLFEELGIKREKAKSYLTLFLTNSQQVSWLQVWTLYVLYHWCKLNKVTA